MIFQGWGPGFNKALHGFGYCSNAKRHHNSRDKDFQPGAKGPEVPMTVPSTRMLEIGGGALPTNITPITAQTLSINAATNCTLSEGRAKQYLQSKRHFSWLRPYSPYS